MDTITTIPFEDNDQNSEEISASDGVANNMVVLYADRFRKGFCGWDDIPETLRESVAVILPGGE